VVCYEPDGLYLWANFARDTAPVCMPSGVMARNIVEVINGYIESASPETRQLAANALVALALANKWPCKATGKPA
jgi:hypothetical protein